MILIIPPCFPNAVRTGQEKQRKDQHLDIEVKNTEERKYDILKRRLPQNLDVCMIFFLYQDQLVFRDNEMKVFKNYVFTYAARVLVCCSVLLICARKSTYSKLQACKSFLLQCMP